MKRVAVLLGVSAIALVVAACNKPADSHDADVQAIKDAEAQWNKDYAARDLDKVVAHYADNAVLMTPGSPAASGKDAIRTALQGMLSDQALTLQFQATVVEVAKSGDVGYTQGSYTMKMTDPQTKQPIHDHGSYVTVYRRQTDQSWKAVSDIASSAVPPAPPPAPEAKKH